MSERTTSAFAQPLAGVRWTRDFERLDGATAAALARLCIDTGATRWFLVTRHDGRYLYVFSAEELLSMLQGRVDPDESLERALDLHEDDASTQARAGEPATVVDPIEGARPSRRRFVEVDVLGQAVAVGGLDVKSTRRVRGRPPSAGSVPSAQPMPSAEAPSRGSGLGSLLGGLFGGLLGRRPAAGAPAPPALPEAEGTSVEGDEPSIDPGSLPAPPAEDEGTTPVRYPSIDADGPVQPGRVVTLVIDLLHTPAPATQGSALQVGDLLPDWDELALGVTLVSDGITFEPPDRAEVTIRRNQPSLAARVRGTVDAALAPGECIEVRAQFWQGRRSCGSAARVLTVTSVEAAAATAPPDPDLGRTATHGMAMPEPHATTGSVMVDPRAAEPDLTVYITLFDPDQPGRMHWRMNLPDFEQRPAKLSGVINLGQDPRAEAVALFKEFAKLPRGQHRERIEGFGERLWKRAPPEFHAAYWALVDHFKPQLAIQFVSDDPHLPWELMRPSRDGETHDLIAIRHAVARWIGAYQGWLHNRLPSGELVVVAPRYSSVALNLPVAQATAQQLLDNGQDGKAYRSRACPGTRAALLGLLEQPPPDATVAMLYFNGHGLFNEAVPSASALKLEERASLTADEVDRDAVRLGTRDGTVVFFNACEVGATAGAIGEVGGWASALAARRFRAFIAPLWAVEEKDASVATLQLIDRILVQRQPIGEALRVLRAEHGTTSPTFYSYILYGDVTARFG